MKIKVNDKVVDIERAVFFGCSFTAGDELYDHLLLGITEDECDALKRKKGPHAFYHDLIYPKLSWPACENYGKTFSWAQKLTNKLQVENLNLARGGAGAKQIFLAVQHYIEEHLPKKTDVVFIGTTFIERLFNIDENCLGHVHVLGFKNRYIDWKIEDLLQFFTYPEMYVSYYSYYAAIIDILAAKGIEVVFVRMMSNHFFDECEKKFIEHMKNLEKSRDFSNNNYYYALALSHKSHVDRHTLDITSLTELSFPEGENGGVYAFGHPKELAHAKLATEIFEEIAV